MIAVRTPNAWSCLAASFATVLDLSVEKIVDLVGHDGSEILWPDLNEPKKRQSFHIQEMIDVAAQYGYSVTPFEAIPRSRVKGQSSVWNVEMKDGNAYRINRYLEHGRGVLTGVNLNGKPHAVAWDGELIHDPAGQFKDGVWQPYSYEPHLFQLETFWRIARAEQNIFRC